ncbi:MAG: hypothetical protein QNK15_04490 [Cycloclasticus sp.]|nr:hypothetical protein [Cycloclasticus sp.]
MTLFKQKRFALEMGFSREEFITLLEAQDKLIYQRDGNVIKFIFATQHALITLGDEEVRRVASIQLPLLHVNFDFSAMGELEQQQFMTLFLLKFHRGGG